MKAIKWMISVAFLLLAMSPWQQALAEGKEQNGMELAEYVTICKEDPAYPGREICQKRWVEDADELFDQKREERDIYNDKEAEAGKGSIEGYGVNGYGEGGYDESSAAEASPKDDGPICDAACVGTPLAVGGAVAGVLMQSMVMGVLFGLGGVALGFLICGV